MQVDFKHILFSYMFQKNDIQFLKFFLITSKMQVDVKIYVEKIGPVKSQGTFIIKKESRDFICKTEREVISIMKGALLENRNNIIINIVRNKTTEKIEDFINDMMFKYNYDIALYNEKDYEEIMSGKLTFPCAKEL